jgi:hypothetical protein
MEAGFELSNCAAASIESVDKIAFIISLLLGGRSSIILFM